MEGSLCLWGLRQQADRGRVRAQDQGVLDPVMDPDPDLDLQPPGMRPRPRSRGRLTRRTGGVWRR